MSFIDPVKMVEAMDSFALECLQQAVEGSDEFDGKDELQMAIQEKSEEIEA